MPPGGQPGEEKHGEIEAAPPELDAGAPEERRAELLERAVNRTEDVVEPLRVLGHECPVMPVLRERRDIRKLLGLLPDVDVDPKAGQGREEVRPDVRDAPVRLMLTDARRPSLTSILITMSYTSMPMLTTSVPHGIAPVVNPRGSR